MRLSFTGDILVEQEQLDALKEIDYSTIFSPSKDAFCNSDIIIGNLETPIAGEDMGFTNHPWIFNTPVQLLAALKDFGFKILTTANNHCLDRGLEGLKRTINNLDKYGLLHTGTRVSTDDKNYCEIQADFGKIALMSYTYGTNASLNNHYLNKSQEKLVNLFQTQEKRYSKGYRYNIPLRVFNKLKRVFSPKIDNHLKNLKDEISNIRFSGAKLIILCLHIGGQYTSYPSKHTRYITKWLLNNGVDFIIGNHEHVIHPVELFGNNFIAYSLGNFSATPKSKSAMMEPNSIINKTEYNLILHLDINNDPLIYQLSFQIAKVLTEDSGISRTHLLYDLITNETNPLIKDKLIEDNEWIVRKVLNDSKKRVTIQREYQITSLQQL